MEGVSAPARAPATARQQGKPTQAGGFWRFLRILSCEELQPGVVALTATGLAAGVFEPHRASQGAPWWQVWHLVVSPGFRLLK